MLPETLTDPPASRPVSTPVPVSRSSVPPPPSTAPSKAQPASTTRTSVASPRETAVPPLPKMVPKLATVTFSP